MFLDLKDDWGVSKHLLKHDSYDPGLIAITKKLIKPGSRAIDAGANIGYWSVFLAKACGCTKVFAFEPEPNNFKLLKENVRLNKIENKVVSTQAGLGSKKEKLKLHLSSDNAGDHQLYDSNGSRSFVEVDVLTFDEAFPDEKIDFVKIDTQGYEPYVLKGMEKTLNSNPDLKIVTEFWPTGIRGAGSEPTALLNDLQKMGFKMYAVTANSEELKLVDTDGAMALCPAEVHIDLVLSKNLI